MLAHICDICKINISDETSNIISFFEHNGLSYRKANPRIELCDSCFAKVKADFVNGENSFKREKNQ